MSRLSVIIGFVFISLAAISCNRGRPLPVSAQIDSLVVIKHDRLLCAYEKGRLQKQYKIALGKHPVGDKHFEGDMCTPEGLYHINAKNAQSAYHKNLGISYPDSNDLYYARKAGKSPGCDIKIHGLRNDQSYLGRFHTLTDWTHGCIAVSNDEIDELFAHINTGTPVNILP